jgi:hypothetical protein
MAIRLVRRLQCYGHKYRCSPARQPVIWEGRFSSRSRGSMEKENYAEITGEHIFLSIVF